MFKKMGVAYSCESMRTIGCVENGVCVREWGYRGDIIPQTRN